jgi:prevent-host-death family protein
MTRISIELVKLRLSLTELLEEVRYLGLEVIITKKGKEIAAIIPIKEFKKLIGADEQTEENAIEELVPLEQKTEILMHKKVLTLMEAAKVLGMSYKALSKRIKMGRIKVIRMGASVRISINAIKDYNASLEEAYTLIEAKNILGISASLLTKLIKEKKIKASKILNKYQIPKTEIDAFLKKKND